MDFTKNIPKYKPKLLSILLTLAIAVTTFMQYPLTVYAEDGGEEIIAKAVAGVIVDISGQDGKQSTLTIENGIKYNRTGYLCYLLQEDGGLIPNMKAYAFECPKPDYIAGSIWLAKARVGGYTAEGGDWHGAAPWNMPPFNEDVTTNQAAIEAWMKETDGDSQNGIQFVYDNWGVDIARKFRDGEYVLVIETLMNFQYSVKTGNTLTIDPSYMGKLHRLVAEDVNAIPQEVVKSMCEAYDVKGRDALIQLLTEKAFNKLKTELANSGATGGTYEKKGIPFIGTVPNIVDYRISLGIGEQNLFSGYTHNNVPFAEKILPGSAGEQAGFTAWTGSTSSNLTDAQIHQYGVAMFVIKAMDDAIHTYWPSNGSPGDPEPSLPNKTGKCNIVKCYYNENLTTHVKTDLGTFTRKDCTNKIIISGEPGFELVEWRVTNQTDLSHNSLTWSPPGSTSQSGKLGKTVTLKEPETCVYVLLRKVEEEEVEEEEYNYIMKESQITRRVYFSFKDPDPDAVKYEDHQLSNMSGEYYIPTYEFKWVSPKIPICDGHPYMDDCPWHDPGCNENCLEDCDIDHSFQHDYDCVEATAHCKDPDWEEKSLLLSINNTLQEDYQNVLVPKSTWNREVELEKETKHYYKDDQPFDRQVLEDIEWHPESGGYPNWDYICVLMRGADKLTLAEWENHGEGNQAKTAADLLVNVSEAGFTMANQDSGTRKTLDYYEKFNAKFDNETPIGVYFFA